MSGPKSRVGDVLAAKYRLEELLGSGGMGDVYRATNELVGRAVAIKLLREEHAENEAIRDRFLREARAANLVRHVNVVDVLDVGEDVGGAPFIVQELLTGEDLSHYAHRVGGKLDLDDVVELVLPVIAAVAEAHAQGIVHRDIKPENVFLARSGSGGQIVPKLLDFGISKLRLANIKMTDAGVMMGTPAYMAPEQIQGARDADPRSDVWALGVMLFELLTGRLPFDSPSAASLFVAIATQDAPSILTVDPSTPHGIAKVIERCLRRLPDERYPSASELARDLRLAYAGAEVEPTKKMSLPPSLLKEVAAVVVPKASNVPVLVDIPDLVPPAPRSSPAIPVAAPAPAPAVASPPASSSAPLSRGRLAPEAVLPGVGLAPPRATSTPVVRGGPSRAAWGLEGRSNGELAQTVLGLAVLGVVIIVVDGALMKFAHQTTGWPLIRFVTGPKSDVATGGQVLLALASFLGGGTWAFRALKQWRGEIAGGSANAVVNAMLAAAAFFAGIELASAAW